MKPYEFKDHTADIIARAEGATLAEAFANAARAMFDIITGGAEIRAVEKHYITVESIDVEGLLVTFLSELIVMHETRNIVLSEFRVTFDSDRRLLAVCFGEPFDSKRHGGGIVVKGVSYHLMEINEGIGDTPCHVQVLFDI
ncbi:MAG: archease [Candidatus Zixiibacteriota bacterium]